MSRRVVTAMPRSTCLVMYGAQQVPVEPVHTGQINMPQHLPVESVPMDRVGALNCAGAALPVPVQTGCLEILLRFKGNCNQLRP